MTQLGRLCADRLGVIARSSCHRVQRADRTPREIGDALRAHYLVEGTVRTEGERVRITAQLIEVRGETQLWADSFERPTADSLLVQSDVATRIVRSVAMELLPDRAPTPSAGTRQVDAYQNYLKGRYHWNRPGDEGIRECLAFYGTALKLDPGFGTAHGALARATVAAADYYLREPREALDAAEAAAARALALDPIDPEALVALAEVRRCRDWDWDGAEEVFRRALSFNPSNEAARRLCGLLLSARGRHDAGGSDDGPRARTRPALPDREHERRMGPFRRRRVPRRVSSGAGTRSTWIRPYLAPHRLLAAARLQIGDVERPHSAFRLAAGGADGSDLTRLAGACRWASRATATRAVNILCHLDELAQDRYVSSYHRALAHAGLGDLDATFTLLAHACDDRDPALMHLASDPRFDTSGQTRATPPSSAGSG